MSNPIEPKFPKRHFNTYFGAEMVAPDGCYLLPADTEMTPGDWSWSPGKSGGWVQPGGFVCRRITAEYVWTYARKLPDGQLNDDLPVQSAPEQAPDDTCLTTAALATQLEFALHAVYENCRQNRNKGIGAGPLAMARSALIAAGVDLKAPLPFEGAPEPDSGCMHRLALTHFTSLLERIIPALLQHRPDLRPVDVARQAAEMARIALEQAAVFSAEPSAPLSEPVTFPEGTVLFPGGPVLRMTHDGKVTAFGAVETPPGCYLLPAGTELRPGDLRLKDGGSWVEIGITTTVGHLSWVTEQFCYARKLPANGPVS